MRLSMIEAEFPTPTIMQHNQPVHVTKIESIDGFKLVMFRECNCSFMIPTAWNYSRETIRNASYYYDADIDGIRCIEIPLWDPRAENGPDSDFATGT